MKFIIRVWSADFTNPGNKHYLYWTGHGWRKDITLAALFDRHEAEQLSDEWGAEMVQNSPDPIYGRCPKCGGTKFSNKCLDEISCDNCGHLL